MVADALQVFGDHQHVQDVLVAVVDAAPDAFEEIEFYFFKILVHYVVVGDDFFGVLQAPGLEGLYAGFDHVDHRFAHFPEILGANGLGELTGEDNLGDVQGLVPDAVQVGHHFEGGGNDSQVRRHRLLLHDQLDAHDFDLTLLLGNRILQLYHLLCQLLVVGEETTDRPVDDVFAHTAHQASLIV